MGKWLSFSSTSHLWNCLTKTVFELSYLPHKFSFLVALTVLFKKNKKKKPILWNLHAIFYIFFSHVYKNSFWYLSLNYIIMEHLNVEFLHLNYIVNCIIHHCRSREISSKSNFKHEKRKVYRRASWVYSRLERVFA